MKKNIILLFFFLLINFSSFSLPSGFREIKLGMSVEDTKTALKNDTEFGYRGDRDVSLNPGSDQILIETDGVFAAYSFLNRCFFQFSDYKLFTITINMNKDKMDHYSVYKTLCKKYGEPDSVTPEKCTWQNNEIIFSLERPLTLKYIDKKVFDQKQKKSSIQKSAVENAKQDFLDQL